MACLERTAGRMPTTSVRTERRLRHWSQRLPVRFNAATRNEYLKLRSARMRRNFVVSMAVACPPHGTQEMRQMRVDISGDRAARYMGLSTAVLFVSILALNALAF